jgi:hypothetical protein
MMDCQDDATIRRRGNVMSRLLWIFAALCLQAALAGPTSAQSATNQSPAPRPGTFQERVDAIALSLADSPRFKDLTQQQRVDRVEFVIGNTLFVLLHEMGHAHIREMRLPVLGRAEDAADEFAVLTLINRRSAFSHRVLVDAAKGWFLSDRRNRDIGEPIPFYDEHELNAQRAYRFVCLMVGSDPEMFRDLAREVKLPNDRRKTCKDEYETASRSWETLLKPHRRTADQPKTEIDVEYGDGEGTFDFSVKTFRAVQFLETIARGQAEQYAWPNPFKLEMKVCGRPYARWEEETRILTICYEEARDFVELYRAYGAEPLDVSSNTNDKGAPPPIKKSGSRKQHATGSHGPLISGNPPGKLPAVKGRTPQRGAALSRRDV